MTPPAPYTHPKRPSMAAAPPGMILVMKMPGSSGMWGLSIPPAMLKPRPELPCGKPHAAPVPRGHLLAGSAGLRAASPPAAPPLQHPPWSGRAAGAWLRGGRRSSARALGAEHPTDGAGAWEPPGPPSPPRLCRETEAGSERGGTRGWSLAEQTSPRWRLPRRRHRQHSPCGEAGLGPTTSICPLRPPRLRVPAGWRLLQRYVGSRRHETSGSLVSPAVLLPNSALGQRRGL